jgi:hypothetical protein
MTTQIVVHLLPHEIDWFEWQSKQFKIGSSYINTNIIAYMGKYPKEFKDLFCIDYDAMWDVSFQSIIQRIFTAIDWGNVSLVESTLNEFIEF